MCAAFASRKGGDAVRFHVMCRYCPQDHLRPAPSSGADQEVFPVRSLYSMGLMPVSFLKALEK